MAKEDQSAKPSIANFSGVLTVLLLVLGAVWIQAPFDTPRPTPNSAGVRLTGLQDVDARLWQDPFGAIAKARTEKRGKELQARQEPAPTPDLLHAPEVLRKQTLVNWEGRRPAYGLTVLSVMVYGGQFVGAEEYRRRTRYAVLSALMNSGYRPFDAEHIGYANTASLELGFPQLVPYEWLESKLGRVIVLWLDESALSQEPPRKEEAHGGPLGRLAHLVETLVDPQVINQVRLDVIGPAGSDMLLAMADEIARYRRGDGEWPELLDRVGFFSPFATISDAHVYKRYALARGETPGYGGEYCAVGAEHCTAEAVFRGERGLREFVRATAPDDTVVNLLFEELEARGVTGESRIAIVGEIDSEYARRLAAEIEAKHRSHAAKPHAGGRGREETVFRFNYMRGVDGRLPESETADLKKQTDKGRDHAQIERPEGDQQMDYVRRLSAAMKQRENRMTEKARETTWSRKKVSFSAIGVIGNDYYDKLLLLQALRPLFPEAMFFTTDIYAAMLHPADNKATRNLIVGAGLGLSLNPDLQNGTPPFRDNYQSAAYLAASLALTKVGATRLAPPKTQAWLQPVAWEVGTTRFFALRSQARATACEGSPLDCPHDLRHARAGFEWWGILLIALAAAGAAFVMFARLRELGLAALRARWVYLAPASLAGLLGVVLVVLACRDAASSLGEPFSWFEGVSVWPSNLMRAAALLVSAVGLCFAWRSVSQRIADTSAKFFREDRSQDKTKDDHENPGRVWNAYRDSMRLKALAGWGAIEFLCVFALFWIIFWHAGSEIAVPARSVTARAVNAGVTMLAVLVTWYLLACIVVAVRRTNFLTRGLARKTDWPDSVRQEYGLPQSSQPVQFDDWLDLQVIARQTEAVNRLVYFPFLSLLLLVLARSPVFDNWSMPTELALVLSVSLMVLVMAAAHLRWTAERARNNAIRALERKLVSLQGNAATALAAQCGTVIDQIRKLNRGAFLPFTQQSMVRAFLALIGGISGAKLLEYAAMANF